MGPDTEVGLHQGVGPDMMVLRLGQVEYQPSWEERCNTEDSHLELYSMLEDPEENYNLAGADGMEELVQELSGRLRRGWRGEAR